MTWIKRGKGEGGWVWGIWLDNQCWIQNRLPSYADLSKEWLYNQHPSLEPVKDTTTGNIMEVIWEGRGGGIGSPTTLCPMWTLKRFTSRMNAVEHFCGLMSLSFIHGVNSLSPLKSKTNDCERMTKRQSYSERKDGLMERWWIHKGEGEKKKSTFAEKSRWGREGHNIGVKDIHHISNNNLFN